MHYFAIQNPVKFLNETTHTIIMKKFMLALTVILTLLLSVSNIAYASENASDSVKLPILMYHSVLKSRNGTYIVSPSQLEQDFKQLVTCGYTAVTCDEIIDYVDGVGSLPEKPVLITFDDGHYNNMYYALPLLKKYNLKATLNVIGKFSDFSTTSGDIDNPNYSHVTWNEVAEMSAEGIMEIGNHTYNMHNYKPRFGLSQKYGESDEQYVTTLKKDIGKLQKILFESTGKQCKVLAYPFGKYNNLAEQTLVDMGFRIMFTCNEGINTITKGKTECLYKLKRINRSGLYDTETLMNKINLK